MEPELGIISTWNDDKGFGFITPKSGGKQVFIHINQFSREHKRPVQGLSVTYDRTTDSKGRNCAVHVCPLKGHKNVSKASRQLFSSILLAGTFFVVIGILVATNKLPIIILGAYIILSLAAFGMYKKDKSAAEWDEWRTPESTLHLISLVGGWPGALVAQSKLRHKSKKMEFRVVYWATVLMNCGGLAWFVNSDKAASIKTLLDNIL